MLRKTAITLCCSALLTMTALAGDTPAAPACCAKPATAASARKATKLRCSLTGKEVDKCCCVPREGGKMHCTLANQDVDKCCCTEVKAETN